MEIRQSKNNVTIEGILNEVDIEESSYMKNGVSVPSIKGTISIKVPLEDKTLYIPVSVFANKFLKDKPNEISSAYTNIVDIVENMTSIAASDEKSATRVRIENGNIKINEYYNVKGQFVSFPKINANFVNRVKPEEFTPEAIFESEMVIGSIDLDEESGSDILKISGIMFNYYGNAEIVNYIATNPSVIGILQQNWHAGDTVAAQGKVNFTSVVEHYTEPVDFGDPIKKTRTRKVSELIISGGKKKPLTDGLAYDADIVKQKLAERQASLEEFKQVQARKAQHTAPAKNSNNFGF